VCLAIRDCTVSVFSLFPWLHYFRDFTIFVIALFPWLHYFLRILYFALFLSRRFYKSSLLATVTLDNFRKFVSLNGILLISQELWICVMSVDVTADLIPQQFCSEQFGSSFAGRTVFLSVILLARHATSHITWSVPTQSTQSNYPYLCNETVTCAVCQSLDCSTSSCSSGQYRWQWRH